MKPVVVILNLLVALWVLAELVSIGPRASVEPIIFFYLSIPLLNAWYLHVYRGDENAFSAFRWVGVWLRRKEFEERLKLRKVAQESAEK